MELSSKDIEKLEEAGYRLEEFAVINDCVTRLRNVDGWCYFYSLAEKNCRVYTKRPLGCYLYPVVHLANEGAAVDELCPMGHTISEQELRTKGKILATLLKKIDNERARATPKLLMQVDTNRNQGKLKEPTKKVMCE
jgi:Fe-S-cluster containining protein